VDSNFICNKLDMIVMHAPTRIIWSLVAVKMQSIS